MTSGATATASSPVEPWPVENSGKRGHRIRFYARCGIPLDPASALSFNEQVQSLENRIASGNRKVISVRCYERWLAALQLHDRNPELLSLTSEKTYIMPTETIALMKETKDGKLRIAHSCNVFDLMVHFHYENRNHPFHGSRDFGVRCLRKKLFVSVENATAFVSTIDATLTIVPTLPNVSVSASAASSAADVKGLVSSGCAQQALPAPKANMVVIDLTADDGGGKPSTLSVKAESSSGLARPSLSTAMNPVVIDMTNEAETSSSVSRPPAKTMTTMVADMTTGTTTLSKARQTSSVAPKSSMPSSTAPIVINMTRGAAGSTALTTQACVPVRVPLSSIAPKLSTPSTAPIIVDMTKRAAGSTTFTTQASTPVPVPPSNSALVPTANRPPKKTEQCQTQPAKRTAEELYSDDLAWTFVDRVHSMICRLKANDPDSSNYNILPVLTKDFVDRTLIAKEEFHRAGKPTKIDIGYHYTKRENMASIREEGLLSMTERASKRIFAVKENGASYGHGIYTGSNPCTYHGKYGDVGLMVARLVGINSDHGTRRTNAATRSDSLTVTRDQVTEMVVLSTSKQCIPILQFDANQIVPNDFGHAGNVSLSTYHSALQRIIDDVLETEKCARYVRAKQARVASRAVSQVAPAAASHQVAHPSPSPFVGPLATTTPQQAAQAPPTAATQQVTTPQLVFSEKLSYMAPETLGLTMASVWREVKVANPSAWKCMICDKGVSGQLYQVLMCQHVFHHGCLASSLLRSGTCPTCSKMAGTPRGDMPSGEMTISRTARSCAGHVGCGTIVIDYSIRRGVQTMYHPNPGVVYKGATRRAYLPETAESCALLKRLKFAFQQGLTFSVGTSLTSGQDNSVIWKSIPHKTSLAGGASRHGYPDANYIADCHNELDKLNVPSADVL
jgi:deltex